jgi:hypothetical protein
MRSQPETGVELKAGEAGLEVTLQQGLRTWIMDQRSGSSTRALVGESIVIYAALQPPCSHFTMGTRRWRPLRAQTRLSGRGGNAECRSERSIPRSEAAWTLPVCSSANLRLLGQCRGGQKTMCCWLQRWWSPSDGCSQRGPCSSSSTSHFAMLQEGDWEGHRALLGAEEMMLCSGCVGPCVPLWAKCPLYMLFHQHKGICLASHC